MTEPAFIQPLSYEEYVALERTLTEKHEYVRGEIFSMAGAKHVHNLIAVNVLVALSQALRERPCFVWNSDMRVRTADDVGTYPDVSALCGEPQFSDTSEDELTNPSVVVEVLSDSTEAYDRGEKFEHYRTMASLRAYLLVATRRRHVDVFTRQADGAWLLRSYEPGESVPLEALGCELLLDALYLNVPPRP